MSRIIYFILISFFISLLLGPIFIPALKILKFGQNIREEGPKSHQKKAGTPAMGGLIFIVAIAITLLVFERSYSMEIIVPLLSLVGFGFIGFLDDYLKIAHKHNEGLKPLQKMILLLILSTILAYYGSVKVGTDVVIPFLNITWDLKFLYIPCMIFFYAAVTNAVNLTDGLDGLATSVSLLIITFFALLSYSLNHMELSIACAVVVGALLGFLKNNAYPARVFMGDTGSIALGGFIASVAMLLKQPIIVAIVAGIPLIEVLSVIIQVTSYKTRKKRVFKMAPIHHHFELCGWHETRVVVMFSIITVILCLIGFLALSL